MAEKRIHRIAAAVLVLGASSCAVPGAALAAPPGVDPVPEIYAVRPPGLFYHTAGALRLMVTNMGILGNPQVGDDTVVGRFTVIR